MVTFIISQWVIVLIHVFRILFCAYSTVACRYPYILGDEMKKQIIQTDDAPQAIGTYSQAIRVGTGDTVYISGQIGLDPSTMQMVSGIEAQIQQVFLNLKAVTTASGGTLGDIVKLNIYLTDLDDFAVVNKIMESYFDQPYPARAAVGVAALPRGALVEMDAVMVL